MRTRIEAGGRDGGRALSKCLAKGRRDQIEELAESTLGHSAAASLLDPLAHELGEEARAHRRTPLRLVRPLDALGQGATEAPEPFPPL